MKNDRLNKTKRKAFAQRAVAYHEKIAAGFRRSAERARSGRSTIQAAIRLENAAAAAERSAEYWRQHA